MDRSAALTALLLVAGVALVAAPVVAPVEDPPDRIEYYTEPTDHDTRSWETLRYDDLSERGRAMVDAARTNAGGTHTVTTDDLDGVPPLASGSVAAYDLQIDGEWYLLQVKYFHTEAPGEDHLLRLGALVAGAALAMAGGYRSVTA